MNPERRRAAHAQGIRRWDDPRVSAAALDVPDKWADQHDAVLAVNRPGGPVVLPERITGVPTTWRTPAPLELYVDFETVSNLADDFSALPAVGGQTLIFQIGCGRCEAGEWRFAQWTVDRLTEADEATVIRALRRPHRRPAPRPRPRLAATSASSTGGPTRRRPTRPPTTRPGRATAGPTGRACPGSTS